MDLFTRFTHEKTPHNNFSCQNFSVENNYCFSTSLNNDRIGNGGAVITVYGKDFAADTFNQFDPNIGNKV